LLILLVAVMLPGLTACWPKLQEETIKVSQISVDPENPPVYGYRVVKTYPHDPGAFTQGLVYEDGVLYEGTGMRGRSSLRKVELETGQVLQIQRLPDEYFGEGIAVWGQRVVQLTWQARTGFVYDKGTFELLQTFSYSTEGWGITPDSEKLIMSDGSSTLYFWDPETLQEIGSIEVRDRGAPVKNLNELEYINGLVFANVWQTDRIAVIDINTGRVVAWLDLAGILSEKDRTGREDVLNGIAYDATNDRLFVTGKDWPKLFEIELIPQS
jgi:glutamine cyclotransferase